MSLESCGSTWTVDCCYPLSKKNLSNEICMFNSTTWNDLRPMYIKGKISEGSKINHRLYVFQENKSIYFIKLNEEGLNEDLH